MYVNQQIGVDEFFFAAMVRRMEIGSIMADARKAAGLTQKAVAEQLGISAQYLCDLELNRRPFPIARVKDLPPTIRSKVAAAMLSARLGEANQLKAWI